AHRVLARSGRHPRLLHRASGLSDAGLLGGLGPGRRRTTLALAGRRIRRRGTARGALVQGRRAEIPPHALDAAQRAHRRGPLDRPCGGASSRRGPARAPTGMDPRAPAPLLSPHSRTQRIDRSEDSMSTPFYGWTIVGVGMVVGCVGFGAMISLTVFLAPIAEAMGWSRTGVSTAALINWLCMGLGGFVWGALSDRFGTRAVVLTGGVL